VEEETYTVQEAARILRTTERTVRRHLERIPPQIEAPQEPRESPEAGEEQQGRGHAPLRCTRRPRCRAAAVVAQGVREREISMDLKTKIMALIEEGWDRNRPPGGVGTTDSATIYTRLLAEGVDVPPGAMARILEDLSAEGQITGPQAVDREGRPLHGGRAIIEPEWRL
jgi:hypothetical protein